MGMSKLEEVRNLLLKYYSTENNFGRTELSKSIKAEHISYLYHQAELTEQYKKDWLHAVKRSDHYKDTTSTLMERIVELEKDNKRLTEVEEIAQNIEKKYNTLHEEFREYYERMEHCVEELEVLVNMYMTEM